MMLRVVLAAMILLLTVLLTDEGEGTPNFRRLFKHGLEGWKGNASLWRVEDGDLIGESKEALAKNEFLYSEEQFGDFELRMKVRFEGHNSGVQIRSGVKPDGHVFGYQADIGDNVWGSLYDELGRGVLVPFDPGKIETALKPDDWNRYVIRCRGDRITLTLNDVVTADYVEASPAAPKQGVIAFQLHSGPPQKVVFRNVRIRVRQ